MVCFAGLSAFARLSVCHMAVPAARSAAARSAALIMLFIMIANVLQVICHAETYGKYVDIEIYL